MTRALVERAMQGDHDAFARLATEAFEGLHTIARLMLRDADLADDAVQETLVRAWQELPRLRDSDRFEPWLRRILINSCNDERRRYRRVLVHQVVLTGQAEGGDGWTIVEDRERLGRAFKRLPIEQRTVVVLDKYLGLSDAEIAATVGIPLGTVKSRLRYAMQALRAAIEADERALDPVPKGHVA